jgi:hypothetical protein
MRLGRRTVADSGRDALDSTHERHLSASEEAFVNDDRQAETTAGPLSAEAVGTLVAFYDMNGFERRRYTIVRRLQALRDSDQFATLPEDLRERIREIVAAA